MTTKLKSTWDLTTCQCAECQRYTDLDRRDWGLRAILWGDLLLIGGVTWCAWGLWQW